MKRDLWEICNTRKAIISGTCIHWYTYQREARHNATDNVCVSSSLTVIHQFVLCSFFVFKEEEEDILNWLYNSIAGRLTFLERFFVGLLVKRMLAIIVVFVYCCFAIRRDLSPEINRRGFLFLLVESESCQGTSF